jgi:glycosyltransferase involved in cell wall biosynthesis
MNILLINHYAVPPSEPGGTRHFAFAKKLMERGHRVLIVASSFNHTLRKETRSTGGEVYRYEEIGGVPFLWVRTPPYSGNTAARVWNMSVFSWRVLQLATSPFLANWGKPDVVWASSPHLFTGLAGERLARRLKIPFLFEVRDLWPESLIALGGLSPRHPFIIALGQIERYLYRNADHIVTLLPLASEYIQAKGADPNKISWLPNGVDLENVPQPELPEPKDEFTILYAGTHGLANGLDILLDAAAILSEKKQAQHIRFRLVGDGPEKPRLRSRAEQLGLRNVSFEDPVPKQDVYRLLASGDALVAILKDADLFSKWGVSPNKIFDYMAVARPVLFAISAPANPVEEAGAGIAVPSNDPVAIANAVLKLAQMTPQERWEMGLRGRRYVEEKHAFNVLVDRLDELLRQMVEGS